METLEHARTTGVVDRNWQQALISPSNRDSRVVRLLNEDLSYTDADGYYMYAYKHTAKSATYKITLPAWARSVSMTVKANGLAAVNFDIP
jgi:hypothetical protein